MNVHLVGSSSKMEQDYPFLKAIVDATNGTRSNLIRNWVEAANHRIIDKKLPYSDEEWDSIMSENSAALEKS